MVFVARAYMKRLSIGFGNIFNLQGTVAKNKFCDERDRIELNFYTEDFVLPKPIL